MTSDKILYECMIYLRDHSNPNMDIGYTHYEVENTVELAIQKTREEMIKEFEEDLEIVYSTADFSIIDQKSCFAFKEVLKSELDKLKENEEKK